MAGAYDVDEDDLKMLRAANGEEVEGLAWGAWMSVMLESLQARGLLTRGDIVKLTPAGREALAEHSN